MNFKSLYIQNFFIILFSIIISISSIAILWIEDIRSHSKKDFLEIKNNYMNSQKQLLKVHLNSIKNNIENIIKIYKKTNPNGNIKNLQTIILNQLKNYRFGKDGYIFVLNNKGINLMNPFKPELNNKNVFYLKDKSGKYLVQEIIKSADSNKFVVYYWFQPSTNKIVQKISYAVKIPEWNWIIGSGLYLDNLKKALEIKNKELEKEIKERILMVIIIFILIVVIISILLYRRMKEIKASFLVFHNFLKKAHKSSNLIDLDKLKYKEFKDLAKDINDMIKKRLEIQKELENNTKQLIEQSRFAQMGELLNMIAHQWRQPLTAISATSMVINLKAEMDELDNQTAIKLSNNISNYTQHLSDTIDDFREFFKSNKKETKTNWSEIINSVLNIIKVNLEHNNIKLHQNILCNDDFVIYANELKQVLLNLIKNAEDVLIERKVKNPLIEIKTEKIDNKCVLEIRDNGGGIPENILDKIFYPYFSTKTKKNGTGIGLYMSKIIVEKHCKGKLSVRNEKNGAVFRIELPS